MRGLSVLVLHANPEGNVERCIESLLESRGEGELSILVLQDGINAAPLSGGAQAPNVRFFPFPKQGLARTLSTGFHLAQNRDVLILDSRLCLLNPRGLAEIRKVTEDDKGVGIVGGKTLFPDGTIDSCGREVVWGLGLDPFHSRRGFGKGEGGEYSSVQEVDAVDGSLAYVRREVVDVLGELDDTWAEDEAGFLDFCLMARKEGFRILFHPALQGRWPEGNASRTVLGCAQKVGSSFTTRWYQKWGWNPFAPDLHRIRGNYGSTGICWRMGRPLQYSPGSQFPCVDVLLVTCNRLPLLKRTLAALGETRYPAFRVLVLDSGSTDGTADALREMEKEGVLPLEVYALPTDVGVPAGLNYLLTKSTAPLVARLDDRAIVPPEWLETLVPLFKEFPYSGVVGVKSVWAEDPRFIHSAFCWLYPRKTGHENTLDAGQVDCIARVNYVKSVCNLYRKEVFQRAGGFDLSFSPACLEDLDHQISVRREGYDILYCGFLPVRYQGEGFLKGETSSVRRGKLRIAEKWGEKALECLEKGLGLSDEKRILRHFPAEQDDGRKAGPVLPFREGEKASIIVLNHNKRDLTRKCLESLYRHTRFPFEVIVVDNGSTDGSLKALERRFPARWVSNHSNLGFARGCNQGACLAEGRILLFLNNDTVVTPGWLEGMVQALEGPHRPGIVGSRLLFRDGSIQHAGVVASFDQVPHHIYYRVPGDFPPVLQEREFQMVTGACLLIRKDLFQRLKGFDEGYENGYEDVDLCLRARGLGEKILYTGRSVVYHLEARTYGRFLKTRKNINRLKRSLSSGRLQMVPDDYQYYLEDRVEVWVRGEKRILSIPGISAPPNDLVERFTRLEEVACKAAAEGIFEKAAELFSILASMKPYDPKLWLALGKFQRKVGCVAGALSSFRKAAVLDPGGSRVALDARAQLKELFSNPFRENAGSPKPFAPANGMVSV